MPLFRQLEKKDQFHFQASENNLKKFPAYIAAAIELTMSIATLQNALHCLEAPLAYAKKIEKVGGDFTAQDLRNKTESILPSHSEEIKNFIKNARHEKYDFPRNLGPVVRRKRGIRGN